MAQRRCSPPSMCSTAPSSAATCSATGTRSSSASSTPPRRRCEWRSTPSSTTPRPTNIPRYKNEARHPRWTFHFTPTSASWLNAVEGFFAKLTRRRLKRGVFRSVADLQAAINRFVEETNSDPKPFVWTADPKRVLAAVKRGKEKLKGGGREVFLQVLPTLGARNGNDVIPLVQQPGERDLARRGRFFLGELAN